MKLLSINRTIDSCVIATLESVSLFLVLRCPSLNEIHSKVLSTIHRLGSTLKGAGRKNGLGVKRKIEGIDACLRPIRTLHRQSGAKGADTQPRADDKRKFHSITKPAQYPRGKPKNKGRAGRGTMARQTAKKIAQGYRCTIGQIKNIARNGVNDRSPVGYPLKNRCSGAYP